MTAHGARVKPGLAHSSGEIVDHWCPLFLHTSGHVVAIFFTQLGMGTVPVKFEIFAS